MLTNVNPVKGLVIRATDGERWCSLAARSKCRPVAEFHELRIGNV